MAELDVWIDGTGSSAALVVEVDDDREHVDAVTRGPGGWQARVVLGASYVQRFVDLDINEDGRGVVAWSEISPISGDWAVVARRHVAGAWQEPTILETTITNIADTPRVAAAMDGSAVVSWVRRTGGPRIAARRWSGSTWSAVRSFEPSYVWSPGHSVAISDEGEVVLAYQVEPIGDQHGVKAVRWVPGTGWTDGHLVNAGRASLARAAMTPNGTAVVLWTSAEHANASLWATERR